MPGTLNERMIGGTVFPSHDVSSLPPNDAKHYLELLLKGDRQSVAEARSILPLQADRDLQAIRSCREQLDRLQSPDRPKIEKQINRLESKIESVSKAITKLEMERDQLEHEAARIRDQHAAILDQRPTRQALIIAAQRPAVQLAFRDELQAAGL